MAIVRNARKTVLGFDAHHGGEIAGGRESLSGLRLARRSRDGSVLRPGHAAVSDLIGRYHP
jgi:hypothetical protein